MRQTFFHELEELEKQEKKEKDEKRRTELFLRKKFRSKNLRDCYSLLSIVIVVILAGSVAVYALYLFVHISRMGNLADVHISKTMNLAYMSVLGKTYSNEALGIKNWMVYEDGNHGFVVRYPENWIYNKESGHLFQIKKYNSQASINESLAAAAYIDKLDNPKKLGLEAIASQHFSVDKNMLSRKSLNGNDFLVSGKLKDEYGLNYGLVCWEKGGEAYFFKVIYYNQKNQVSEQEFEKMLTVLEITK